jgi:hypothetical protein
MKKFIHLEQKNMKMVSIPMIQSETAIKDNQPTFITSRIDDDVI